MLWKGQLATLDEDGDKESEKSNLQTIGRPENKESGKISKETCSNDTKTGKLENGGKDQKNNVNSEEPQNISDTSTLLDNGNTRGLKDNNDNKGTTESASNLLQSENQQPSSLENRRRSLSSENRHLLQNRRQSISQPSDKTPSISPLLVSRRRHSVVGITSSTPLGEKPVPKICNRRLSVSTIGKLGVSEYGRNALRFKSLGEKIWKMISVKNMFSLTKADDEDNQLFEYKENNNKELRFSSSLSPEAQFALMKGYEDKNYEEIARLYPESKRLLKRPRTPVSILGKPDDKISQNGAWEKLKTSIKVDVMKAFSIHNDDYESPLRRRQATGAMIPNFADLFRSDKFPVVRGTPNSPLQDLIPDDKRRIFSYRLENAMDILDTLKHSTGQHTVSPRLKTYKNPLSPVKAYNKWTDLWISDFK